MMEWAECHRKLGLKNFISDGIINEYEYQNSTPKIVFFLKEAYSKSDDGGWSLTHWLDNGALTKMWGTVSEWIYGIRNTTLSTIPPKPELTREEKTLLLKTIAVVNVKKSNGEVSSKYDDLLRYATRDISFLKKEIQILDSDIIVCGNNSSLLRMIYGATVQDNKVNSDGLIDSAFMKKNE